MTAARQRRIESVGPSLHRSGHGSSGDEGGLATTELAILMPFILVLVLVVTFAGRMSQHESRTQAAADAAARSAALFVEENDARAAATAVAKRTCDGPVTIDVTFDAREPADFFPGWVEVEVKCTESFDELALLGGMSERTSTARAVAVREFWRGTT